MLRKLLILVGVSSLLIFSACGKNESVRSVGTSAPYGYQPPPPPGYQPPPPGYQPPPPFNPQMPPGYPPQYTPFLPVHNFFIMQPPVIQNYYINVIMPGWQTYAQNYGYNPYDFGAFWYDYCPQYLDYDLYNYFDYNYYGWANQGYSYCDYGCDPYDFWFNYY